MFDIDADLASVLAEDLAALPDRETEATQACSVDQLLQRMDRAWARTDPIALVATGRALGRKGALTEDLRIRLAQALIELGMAGEAVEVLGAPANPEEAPFAFIRLAEALAAQGRFRDAEAAVGQALQAHPNLRAARDLSRRVRKLRKHIDRAPLSWDMAAYVVPMALDLGARAAAIEVVRRLLANAPPMEADTTPHAIRLAAAAVELVPAGELEGLVETLTARFGSDDAVQALRLRWLVRAGRIQEAAACAAEVRDRTRQLPALALAAAEALDAAGDPGAAIDILAPLLASDAPEEELRTWLAYCTGRIALDPEPVYAAPRPARVINLFPFYNELTILKIRLREMASWVDQFVLVEAAHTFTGRPKPFHFDEFKAAVAEFEPKIVRVRLPEFPGPTDRLWAREFYQRDVAVSALDGMWRPDDIVLVTDVDEIVERRAIEDFDVPLASLRMQTHRYFLNYCAKPGTGAANRRSGFACRAEVLRRFGSTYIRVGLLNRMGGWWNLPQAGWHLTSIGDADAIADKFRNFSHQETSKAVMRDTSSVGEQLAWLRKGGVDAHWERRDIDASFPAYIREHQDELAPLILQGD